MLGRDRQPDSAPRRPRPARWAVVGLLAFSAGCRSNGKYDLIEAELRTRTRELEETRAELQHHKHLGEAYGRPLPGGFAGPAMGNVPGIPLREIVLGTGTGGLDDDGVPGDEGLQVVIVPRDDDGTAVKVPARATVQAFEVSKDGLKTAIGEWDVPPDQLRRTWRGGLFVTGYFVPLKWDRPPTTDKLRVVVRLTTLDGRPFEADKDVSIRPPGGGQVVPGVPTAPPQELPPPGGVFKVPARFGLPVPVRE